MALCFPFQCVYCKLIECHSGMPWPGWKQPIPVIQFPRYLLSYWVRIFEIPTPFYKEQGFGMGDIFGKCKYFFIFQCRIITWVVCTCTFNGFALSHIISIYCLCYLIGDICVHMLAIYNSNSMLFSTFEYNYILPFIRGCSQSLTTVYHSRVRSFVSLCWC